MPLRRNSKQNQKRTLQSFYLELTADSSDMVSKNIGIDMLAFIDMINRTFIETEIWGLTSLFRLVLQTEDRSDSDWYIIVNSIGNSEYHFEYLLPAEKQPWPNARVTGGVTPLEEAKKYLLISMKECGAWQESSELRRLLRNYNL